LFDATPGRPNADYTLQGVLMIAVIDVLVVVNIVLQNLKYPGREVDRVVAEVIDLVA
jgi:hypothetical protein